MSFGNPSTAAGDLMQIGQDPSYEWYLGIEGGYSEPSSEGSINIPWLLGLSLALGNAATKALGEMANIYAEPEWGWDVSGGGKDIAPGQQMWIGGATGGFIRSW